MHKVKANALWNELSAEQLETLDRWLFAEKMSYAEAWQRAQKELGFKGSTASIQRYHARRDKERIVKEFKDLRQEVAAISGAPVGEKELRAAAMKVLGQFLFRQVRQSPEKVKEWGMVASLMVDNDRNELLRELKGEELRMRQEAMDFAREKFRVDMVKQALKALPELLELDEAKRDPALKEYEENIRLNRAIRAMFGPTRDVHPETPEEAAQMLAAKRGREARQQAEHDAAVERRRIQEELGGAQPPPPGSRYYEEYMAANAAQEAEEQERERKYQESLKQAESDGEKGKTDQEHKENGTSEAAPQKPSKQYQEYLDKLKQWENNRELLGWEGVPRPEWSGRWLMTEEE